MNLLLHHLIDDHITLTPDQHKRIRQETMKRASAEPRANLLRLVPGMLPLLAIPFIKSIRARYGIVGDLIFEVLLVIIGLSIVYWLFRRAFIRHARSAIRDLGFADICPRCGYDLTNRATSPPRCPECGTTCDPFNPRDST